MAEKEYIESGALLNELGEELKINTPMYNKEQNEFVNRGIKIAIRDIRKQPTADVQEVRYGEWIKEHIWYGDYYYKCSCCSTKVGRSYIEDFSHKNFCPDCGAKMKVKEYWE